MFTRTDDEQVDENKDPNVVLNSSEAEAIDTKMQDRQMPTINIENQSQPSSSQEKNNEEIKQSNEQQPTAFNRNSTLSKSQRKRVVPQMNIKNLVLNSDVFSPPVLEQIMTPPLISDVPISNQKMTNGNDLIDHQRNSPEQNSSQLVLNDPLGVSNSMNNDNLNFSTGTIGIYFYYLLMCLLESMFYIVNETIFTVLI